MEKGKRLMKKQIFKLINKVKSSTLLLPFMRIKKFDIISDYHKLFLPSMKPESAEKLFEDIFNIINNLNHKNEREDNEIIKLKKSKTFIKREKGIPIFSNKNI